MFRGYAKAVLTACSIAPVALVYAWLYAVKCSWFEAAIATLTAGSALLLAWLLLRDIKETEELEIQITSIETSDNENIAFLVLYLFPLLSSELSTPNLMTIIPILLVFSVVVATSNSYHFNPLLGFMGWHFYKVGTPEGVTYVLISKRTLKDTEPRLDVREMTNYMLMDTREV